MSLAKSPQLRSAAGAKNIAPSQAARAVSGVTDGVIRRVVIADSEARTRTSLAKMLADEGFDVVGEAVDGDQALSMAQSLRPDLVILEASLPNKDGIDATADITGALLAPVVVVSAVADRDQVTRARDAGASAYLITPVSRASLVPAVEVTIARYAETAALRADVAEAAQRLESRKVIDRAKGLLMAHHRMTEPEAFRWIQQTAMDRRATALAVANGIVEELASKPLRRAAS